MIAASNLQDFLLTMPNLMIMLAAGTLISIISKALPKVAENPLAMRLKPAASSFLCAAMCLLPNAQPEDMSVTHKVLLGVILGALTSQAYKLFTQTVLGKDKRIKGA